MIDRTLEQTKFSFHPVLDLVRRTLWPNNCTYNGKSKMRNTVVTASMLRFTAMTFIDSAKDLEQVFRERSSDGSFQVSSRTIPYNYLVCHSIELLLKSILALRGTNEEDLRKNYGHNLGKLTGAIRESGLCLSESAHQVIVELSEQHRTHMLRYDTIYAKNDLISLLPDAANDVFNELLKLFDSVHCEQQSLSSQTTVSE